MTSEDWWVVGARLLGIYFIVNGALTVTGAVMMLGVGLPDETPRWVVVAAPLLQALISAGAGAWLVNRPAPRAPAREVTGGDAHGSFRRALQLLGIFLLVSGASELADAAIGTYFISGEWHFRASRIASGVVSTSAGVLLLLKPTHIAERLGRVTG